MKYTCTKSYANDDFEIDGYSVDFVAYAHHFHDDGCMYMRNGDPGYPPEDDFEITSVDTNQVMDIDTGEEITDSKVIETIIEKITDWLYDHTEVFEEV